MRLKVDNFNYFVNCRIDFGLYAKKLSFIPPSCLLFSFLTLSSHFMLQFASENQTRKIAGKSRISIGCYQMETGFEVRWRSCCDHVGFITAKQT